jgi:hypothetical protein
MQVQSFVRRLVKTIVKRVLSNRRFKISVGLALVLAAALVACAGYFRVWNWHDLHVYREMSKECHPVWRDLHWGRIRAGQNVDDVIAATEPLQVTRYGEFVELEYQQAPGGFAFTGVRIIAKNGRLAGASAGSCCWDRTFFDELSPDDWKAYDDASLAYRQSLRKKREAEQAAAPDRGGE